VTTADLATCPALTTSEPNLNQLSHWKDSLFNGCGRDGEQTRKTIMRPSVKLSLTGLLIAAALVFSAVGVEAMGGGNGADAFIGIINGGLQPYNYGAQGPYTYDQGGGLQANTGHQFGHVRRHRQGGYGGRGYEGGYHGGY
jgi:hypothetical protein